jgi:hypothetical protein
MNSASAPGRLQLNRATCTLREKERERERERVTYHRGGGGHDLRGGQQMSERRT